MKRKAWKGLGGVCRVRHQSEDLHEKPVSDREGT